MKIRYLAYPLTTVVEPSFLTISSDLACSFLLGETWFPCIPPPREGALSRQKHLVGQSVGWGKGDMSLMDCHRAHAMGFSLLSRILGYVISFVWSLLLPLWRRVAQDSRNLLEMPTPKSQGSCGDVSYFTFCQQKTSWRTEYLLLHFLCFLAVFLSLEKHYQ